VEIAVNGKDVSDNSPYGALHIFILIRIWPLPDKAGPRRAVDRPQYHLHLALLLPPQRASGQLCGAILSHAAEAACQENASITGWYVLSCIVVADALQGKPTSLRHVLPWGTLARQPAWRRNLFHTAAARAPETDWPP
jgi:hypothetical protein